MEQSHQINPHYWLNHMFSAKAQLSGGVVRRSRTWVEDKIGQELFEETVRAWGYHLLETGDQLMVICHPGPVHMRF